MATIIASSQLAASPTEVYDYHARPGAIERLLPPWQRAEIVRPIDALRDGAEAELSLRFGPLRIRWVAEHRDIRPGVGFRDGQRRGPFAFWEHEHLFVAEGDGCRLEDEIHYPLPGGALAALIGDRAVRRTLARTFRFRHARTRRDLARQHSVAQQPRLRIALSGASGLFGRALTAWLSTAGHEIVPLVRRFPAPPGTIAWDPAAGRLDVAPLVGVDARRAARQRGQRSEPHAALSGNATPRWHRGCWSCSTSPSPPAALASLHPPRPPRRNQQTARHSTARTTHPPLST